ncbi:uncharacterized protein [Choristoneura fumiferana]|uniref:uncharacterized protein n=1 Tax=Choristoneura fumiferana TaxID=7141 RepID=UPI003D1596A0
MGDSSAGTDKFQDAMEMVSKPGKRAIVEENGNGEDKPAPKISSVERGRAPSGRGAYAGIAAAKAKLQNKDDDDYELPTEKAKAYRLEFPALRSLRSRSQGNKEVNKERDRSPSGEGNKVTISDLSEDECDDTQLRQTHKLFLKENVRISREKVFPATTNDELTPDETGVVESVRNAARTVLNEAAKSSNLNGVVRGNINAACREILEGMEYLENKKESDELRKLKADNKRMREQLALLSAETKALRTAFAERKSEMPQDISQGLPEGLQEVLAKHSQELFRSLGTMINARLEAFESRLPPEPIMRPPLAADRASRQQDPSQPDAAKGALKKTKSGKRSASQPETAQPPQTAQPAAQPNAQSKPKPKPQVKAQARREHLQSTSKAPEVVLEPSWTEVVRRKAKPKAAKHQEAKPTAVPKAITKTKPASSRVLTAPKSSAVVVTLKPEANVTYLSALQKVTTSLRLAEVGIESVRVRKSATGARLIEVPGASSGRAADDLAQKIEGLIGDVATVHRPVKTADLRVTGFDESVTSEDIKTAVVLKGGCSIDQVKVGPIRLLSSGMGSALLRCPVTAANALIKDGKILVGWSAAHIKALEPQPMRCYRCMGTGHTRALCPSPIDRGDLCYRCSRPGHKSAECEAEPFCGVCHHAKRPAGHVMGGRACAPPSKKGRDGPQTPNWTGATDGRVALVVPTGGGFPTLTKVENGPGYVAAKWGKTVVIAVYFSPNRPLPDFEAYLEGLGRVVRRSAPAPTIVLGDLNAKSEAWGSPHTDTRGATLRDWTAAMGLEVLNQGDANTCVRRQGGSIVDITFATPAIAQRIIGWRVLEDVETLSDHLYIRMRVSAQTQQSEPPPGRARNRLRFPRWVISQFDSAMAEEAAIIEAWGDPPPNDAGVEVKAARFRESLTAVCDASMPRVRKLPAKQSVYWWSDEIAALRTTSNNARRAYTRCRRRRSHTAEEEEFLHRELKTAKEALQLAITKAKDSAFEEFVDSLNRNPWGRPYKMVRNKIKRAPTTETLEPELLDRVVETLFPPAPDFAPPEDVGSPLGGAR